MTGVRFTRSAETDLLELWLNIAEENLVAADESLDVIQAAVSILSRQPELGRSRPELADGLRSFPEGVRVVSVSWHRRFHELYNPALTLIHLPLSLHGCASTRRIDCQFAVIRQRLHSLGNGT